MSTIETPTERQPMTTPFNFDDHFKIIHVSLEKPEIIDPCVHCGESTAFGFGNYVNRLGWDDGWSCAMCAGYECDLCDQNIYLDEDHNIDGEGHYHWACLAKDPCPNHKGNFDCTPFCERCDGMQEIIIGVKEMS
jgi:hypothetical protein